MPVNPKSYNILLNLGKTHFPHLDKRTSRLRKKFEKYLSNNIELPGGLGIHIFSPSFLSADYYLTFTSLFNKAFGQKDGDAMEEICISGFLYFKYLLCIDSLVDNDSDEDRSLILLKSHVYHEEAMKLF